MINYYEIIGVNENANYNEIKIKYLSKIKQYHPDLYQGDKVFAEQKTAQINEAYNTLKDPQKRAEYNKSLSQKTGKKIKIKKAQKPSKIKAFFKNLINKIKQLLKKNKNKEKTNKNRLNYNEKLKLNIIIVVESIVIFILLLILVI